MEQQSQSYSQEKIREFEVLESIGKLWQKKKIIYKFCGISMFFGLIIAFSIPKEYSVTVMLSPESSQTNDRLASMTNMLDLGNFTTDINGDAMNIKLFPEILSSNPFALELYSMPVVPDNSKYSLPLNEYMDKESTPWWNWVLGLPGRIIGKIVSLFSGEKNISKSLDPFRLTKKETQKLEAIKRSMSAVVDQKTGVTTITVTLQDAVVAATVADSVVSKLQYYVTAYRIKKATEDCSYWEKLYKERQREYYVAQQRYANYMDENKSLYTQKSKVEGERLQNDMNLAYQVYNQMAQQLQVARGRIQEAKPVFAVVNPATVPINASAPHKIVILIGCIFFAFIGASIWILFGNDSWEKLNKILKEN